MYMFEVRASKSGCLDTVGAEKCISFNLRTSFTFYILDSRVYVVIRQSMQDVRQLSSTFYLEIIEK